MIGFWFEVFIGLALGILLSYKGCWLWLVLLLSFLGLTAFQFKSYSRLLLVAAAAISVGAVYFFTVANPVVPDLKPRDSVSITGTVASIPSFDGQKTRFVISNNDEHSPSDLKRLQVSCYFKAAIHKGDRVELRGAVKIPAPPGNPGEFDYPRYLSFQHIFYLFIVKNQSDLSIISPPGFVQRQINNFTQNYEKMVYDELPKQEGAILLGMLLGKVDDIDPEQYSDFQKTGIIHVFSVSGLHVGFLVLLCAWVASFFKLSPRSRFLACLTLMLLYGSLVSWPVPVQRAVIMAALALLAHYMGREQQILNSLGLAGTIILVLDPYTLFMIPFQLTFLATWGLLYLFPLCKKRLAYKSIVGDSILLTLCAQAAVVPVIACYFNLFSPISLLSNLLTTLLSAVVVIMGFLALLLTELSAWFATFFLYPAGLCIELILVINKMIVQIPGAYIWVASPAIFFIALYYAGLLLLANYGEFERRRAVLLTGIVLIALFCMAVSLPARIYDRGSMEVVFIDVGQGDGILVKSPQGKFILVDGGGSQFFDPGSDKVLPYLHRRGIRELYMVVNSHPDMDHLQGLEKVVKEMPVEYLALPACLVDSPNYNVLKNLAFERGIPLLKLSKGQLINIEKDWKIKVLYPGNNAEGEEYNNSSLTLRIAFREFSLLLPGDLEKEGLANLLKTRMVKPSTIIKIPHHGSKGSLLPELYDKTRPEMAVISVGANNNFGHPHPDLLEALQKRGIRVLRTDLNGAVRIITDGQETEVQPTRGVQLNQADEST